MASLSTAVAADRVARVLGIKVEFVDLRGGAPFYLPPSIGVFAQPNHGQVYVPGKTQITSQGQAAEIYGYGSPIHLIAQQLFPAFGDGVGSTLVTVFPLDDGTVAAEWTITPVGVPSAAFTAVVTVGGKVSQNVGIAAGASVADMTAAIDAAVSAVLDMPVNSTDGGTEVTFDSKWRGASANDIQVSIEGGAEAGVTFAVAQTVVGSGNPDVTTPLTLLGNTWHNLIINALDWTDTTNLDRYSLAGEGRWGSLVHKPMCVFTGTPETDIAVLTTAGNLRKSDRTNSTISVPGATAIPFMYAARAVVRIAQTMSTNPARDYARLTLSGLPAGPEEVQFDTNERDTLVKAGISTVEVVSGVFELSDTVTYYHPDDEPIPGYRFVKDQVKVWNGVFLVAVEFNQVKWDGAPIVDRADAAEVENPDAKDQDDFAAAIYVIIDSLVRDAMATKAADMKATVQVDFILPDRVDIKWTHILSSNGRIIAVDQSFGFFFGG